MPDGKTPNTQGQRDSAREQSLEMRIRSCEFKRLKFLTPFCFKSIDSTQEYLSEHCSREGEFAQSEVQTKGRGRQGRNWVSGEGGLWFSILLKPDHPGMLDRLVLIAAEAIKDTLLEYSLQGCTIKHPNDVYCNGRKIAGVLADAKIYGDDSIVYLGIGVNLNNDPASSEEIVEIATSYLNETGNHVDLEEFLVKLLLNLDERYHDLNKA